MKITTIALRQPPENPEGANDRLVIGLDDGSTHVHIFASRYKDKESFDFMLLLYNSLSLGTEVRQ